MKIKNEKVEKFKAIIWNKNKNNWITRINLSYNQLNSHVNDS